MATPKLSDDDCRMITARVSNGEARTKLAEEYDVAVGTIRKAIEKVQGGKMPTPGAPPVSITEFKKRAHKLLWAANPGKEKIQYDRWEAMVAELKSKSKLSDGQVIVQVSKSFDVLRPLFATCDVSSLDPHPGSHAGIVHYGRDADAPTIRCLNKKLTNRENLTWAIEAAGRYIGEKAEPEECPNWAAYYLYNQARSDPGGFTGKYLTAELRLEGGEDTDGMRKEGKKSIAEIDSMLDLLNQKPEESASE